MEERLGGRILVWEVEFILWGRIRERVVIRVKGRVVGGSEVLWRSFLWLNGSLVERRRGLGYLGVKFK